MALGVECELSSREMIDPVVLLMIAEHPEVRFDLLVFTFDFAVALGVIGGGQFDSDTEPLEKGSHESGGKLGTTIGVYDPRQSVETEDLTIVDIRLAFSRGGGVTRDQVGLAGGMVNIDRDGVISIRFRELSDMVNSDNLPGLRWSFLRLEGGLRMTGMLVPLTDVAASNVVLDEGSHTRPLIVSRD